jgi:hypothetical protein
MFKLGLCLASVVLIFLFWLSARGGWKRKRVLLVLLALIAMASIPAYFDFGFYPKHGRFMNPHTWFHYYMGSKYSQEVGYRNLYEAVVVADNQNTGKTVQTEVRSMDTYRRMKAGDVVRENDKYLRLFSPARWREFREDVAYFRSIFIPRRWPGVVTDKGYNGTPTWNVTGAVLSNMIPTSSRAGMLFLLSLDILLSVAMLVLVKRAFGARAALFTTIYLCTHFAFFMYNVNEIRGAFLRLDWVTLIVMSMCLMKLDRYKTAGGLMAYAGLARIFPLIFVFGIAVRFAWDFMRTGKINRRYFGFFATFATVAILLVAASVAWGGFDAWKDFLAKISMHDSEISSQRTGFKYVFVHFLPDGGGNPLIFEQYKPVWWAILASALVLGAACVLRCEDYEAIAVGYIPLFFLTAPTTYYHIGLLIPLFFFLPKMEKGYRAVGAAMLFGISAYFVLLNLSTRSPSQLWRCSYVISCVLLIFVLYMGFAAMMTWRRNQFAAAAPSSNAAPASVSTAI